MHRPGDIQSLLASLDIPFELVAARGLAPQPEASELVIAETDANGREHRLTPAAARAWSAMKAAAAADGVGIRIVSAFRTIERQAEIVRAKLQQGIPLADILHVSAPPGYSEHHTGCAVDVGAEGSQDLEEEFERTPAFAWLSGNASRFGFQLSFPPNNRLGYAYEPWHWIFRPSETQSA